MSGRTHISLRGEYLHSYYLQTSMNVFQDHVCTAVIAMTTSAGMNVCVSLDTPDDIVKAVSLQTAIF